MATVQKAAIAESDPAEKRDLARIRNAHDSSYIKIAKGLTLEESGQHLEAIPNYEDGLKSMDDALAVRCDQPFCAGRAWDLAREQQMKMRRIRKVLEDRLNYLKVMSETSDPFDHDALRQFAENLKGTPPTYTEMQLHDDFLDEKLSSDDDTAATPAANASELFCIPDGAQIFFVSPEGHVSAPSSPSSLKILKLEHTPPGAPPGCTTFLQVGTWNYPLMPGASPSLHADYGAYLLPDLTSDIEGACVGIILGSAVSEQSKKQFQDLMEEFTVMKQSNVSEAVKDAVPEERTATLRKERATEIQQEIAEDAATGQQHLYTHPISRKIYEGAELIAWAVQKGADKVDKFVKAQSQDYRGKLGPDDHRPVFTSPIARKSIKYARVATGWTYKVSKKAVKQVGHTSWIIAKYLAPKITASIEKTLPRSWKTASEAGGTSKVDNMYEIGASGVQGVAMVYVALDNAAKLLAASLIDESVQIVHLKYGEGAADAVYAGGNVVMTGLTVRNLGVKGVAKKAAVRTGQVMFQDWHEAKKARMDNGSNGGTPQLTSVTGSSYGSTVTMEALPPSQGVYPQLK